MKRFIPALGLIAALIPTLALAGGAPPASCPGNYYCDSRLGLALRLPAGWYAIPRQHFAGRNEAAFAQGKPAGLSYNVRLYIRAYAVTSFASGGRAVQQVVAKLIHAQQVANLQQTRVHYAGSSGLLIRGLPSSPTPALEIFLGRHQYVYQIIAPGAALAPDQLAALNSLRRIPIQGSFLGAHG